MMPINDEPDREIRQLVEIAAYLSGGLLALKLSYQQFEERLDDLKARIDELEQTKRTKYDA